MGERILAAFGYVRRRRAAIDEINAALVELGLRASPSISQEVPLRSPRIRFFLASEEAAVGPQTEQETPESDSSEEPEQESDLVDATLVSSFRIAELTAADKPVQWISPNAALAEAYTLMALNKYSQLVVASSARPRQQDIKGIVSYQSITKALLAGRPPEVRECMDDSVPVLRSDADLKGVVPLLSVHDVVLVVGPDRRLQGIVTAWDLAEEFAQLADPFKRIGEVEARLRALLKKRLGTQRVGQFLSDHPAGEGEQREPSDELTIGDLQRLIENSDNWSELGLVALDKGAFVAALDRMRTFRNRLMHFRTSSRPSG